MSPSLRNIALLEAYLQKQLPVEEAEQVRVRLLTDTELADQLEQQQQTYRLIRQSGRRHLKRELEQLHNDLFSQHGNKTWQQKIRSFFDISML